MLRRFAWNLVLGKIARIYRSAGSARQASAVLVQTKQLACYYAGVHLGRSLSNELGTGITKVAIDTRGIHHTAAPPHLQQGVTDLICGLAYPRLACATQKQIASAVIVKPGRSVNHGAHGFNFVPTLTKSIRNW